MMSDSLIEEARVKMSEHGGRMTSQRRLILKTLQDTTGHPTADELYEIVSQEDPGINLSTVYRTLRWLEQEGLVSARMFDEDRGQVRFDPGMQTEHHFVCTVCRQVFEFSTPQFEQIVLAFEAETGAKVSSGSIVLRGVCPDCAGTLEYEEDEANS